MKIKDRFFYNNVYAIVLALGSVTTVHATDFDISINTMTLAGSSGSLVFDLINGGNSNTNTVSIFAFSTDGILGTIALQGDAIGNLPATATLDTNSNAFFLNELAQNITYGKQISFAVDFTQNFPDPSGSPDSFSLFLLDSNGNPIPTTTDQTGANSLVQFNIDGSASGNLNVYAATSDINNQITWSVIPAIVPIPAAFWLFVSGLIGLGLNAANNFKRR